MRFEKIFLSSWIQDSRPQAPTSYNGESLGVFSLPENAL